MSMPAAGSPGPAHHAQFYDDLPFLAARVASYLDEALRADGGALVIARADHREAFVHELRTLGQDPDALRVCGRLVVLDADAMIADVMIGELPDRERFRAVVGAAITSVQARCTGRLHVYGEMVDILWAARRGEAVLAIEELWAELARERSFSILCGYRLGAFAQPCHVHMFRELCARHDEVSPSEQLHGLGVDIAATRTIVQLEQRARALQTEVARRGLVELRLEQLLDLTGELAGASSHEEITQLALDKGIGAVRAIAGGLWLLDRKVAALTMLASTRDAEETRPWALIPLAVDTPLTHVLRTGEPLFLTLADHEARFPATAARLRAAMTTQHLSYALLPLIGNGEPIGVLGFGYDCANELDANDRTYLSILARQCGLALERVRLHEIEREAQRELARSLVVERQARLEADEATSAREELLSVVSHDLRNPLGTILMCASTLLHSIEPTCPMSTRTHTIVDRIHRQAERMARLIDDLVDFATIQAGRCELARGEHEPSKIIAQARDLFGPIVAERGVAFEAHGDVPLPAIECDSERAVQILSSLVSNAIKVTPRGGQIAIGVQPVADDVVFFVRDTGPGIAPDELPRLFERHWRSTQSSYKGVGLGLSIARGLVDAHGGRIWVESQLGAGSTFYFSLSSTRNN